MATLVVLENKKKKTYCLDNSKNLQFGRQCPGNIPDIAVSSPIVGRKHGDFVCIEEEWFYLDQGSRNGTYYNGKKLTLGLNGKARPILLSHGDVLQVDSENLEQPDGRGVRITFLKV